MCCGVVHGVGRCRVEVQGHATFDAEKKKKKNPVRFYVKKEEKKKKEEEDKEEKERERVCE